MVPSVCNEQELYSTKGKQQVKIEFLYSIGEYKINRIKQPELFALETEHEFNVLALENLFGDKLTTLGPSTIGISDHRKDEQFKQLYDVITLFTSNVDFILHNKEIIKENYIKVAKKECLMHGIEYDADLLYEDMQLLLKRVENIESNDELMARAYDFQGFYLRNTVNRDKSGWVIAAYQVELLTRYIFKDDNADFKEVDKFIDGLTDYIFDESNLLNYAKRVSKMPFTGETKQYVKLYNNISMFLNDKLETLSVGDIEEELKTVLGEEYKLIDENGELKVQKDNKNNFKSLEISTFQGFFSMIIKLYPLSRTVLIFSSPVFRQWDLSVTDILDKCF